MKRIIEILNSIFETFKGRIIKFALIKIFGRVVGGVKGYIITKIVGRLVDKVIKPAYKWATRKTYIFFKKFKFKKAGKKVEEAESENDFNDSFDDLP